MIDKITLKINEKQYQYTKGISLEEVSKNFSADFKYPILLASVNNTLRELSDILVEDAKVEFLDLTSSFGNRIHISNLTFILLTAVKKLFGPEEDIKVQHSLDKGIYIETTFKLTEPKLLKIKDMMNNLILSDIPITKVTVDYNEALKYFKNTNDKIKESLVKYISNNYMSLYRLGDNYNYFYTLMPTSTSKTKDFDLTYISDKAFVLRFPTPYINNKIKDFENHPKMLEVFKEYHNWGKIMNVETSVDLNNKVSTGKIADLIRIDETLQNNKLLTLATEINKNKKDLKVVLIAGPSSSGKTTTTRKLSTFLQSYGINPKVLSMDDYFVDKEETPIGKDGKPDYECLEAMDLKLFDKQMDLLLKNEEVLIPTFNFILCKKEYKQTLKLEENDILLIEGIHALDSKILTNINSNKKYKVYLSALTELNIDYHNRISTTDNRLLRRIIRDNRTRNYKVESTLKTWPNVRLGEEKYIFPFQDEADFVFNTALIYEIGVLKTYVEPLLYSVPYESEYYEEARRLINFLRLFLPITADDIPKDSILREFIGGSCFHD